MSEDSSDQFLESDLRILESVLYWSSG